MKKTMKMFSILLAISTILITSCAPAPDETKKDQITTTTTPSSEIPGSTNGENPPTQNPPASTVPQDLIGTWRTDNVQIATQQDESPVYGLYELVINSDHTFQLNNYSNLNNSYIFSYGTKGTFANDETSVTVTESQQKVIGDTGYSDLTPNRINTYNFVLNNGVLTLTNSATNQLFGTFTRYTPPAAIITKEMLAGTWTSSIYELIFSSDFCIMKYPYAVQNVKIYNRGEYTITGDKISIIINEESDDGITYTHLSQPMALPLIYNPVTNTLVHILNDSIKFTKKVDAPPANSIDYYLNSDPLTVETLSGKWNSTYRTSTNPHAAHAYISQTFMGNSFVFQRSDRYGRGTFTLVNDKLTFTLTDTSIDYNTWTPEAPANSTDYKAMYKDNKLYIAPYATNDKIREAYNNKGSDFASVEDFIKVNCYAIYVKQ